MSDAPQEEIFPVVLRTTANQKLPEVGIGMGFELGKNYDKVFAVPEFEVVITGMAKDSIMRATFTSRQLQFEVVQQATPTDRVLAQQIIDSHLAAQHIKAQRGERPLYAD